MTLRDYARKRRFTDTPEPADDAGRRRGRGAHRPIFVVQLHNARARHYDFRLEADGALKSWAVPKGPSLRAGEKRLAVEVEDHPLSYAGFQGEIPEGNYGAGHVLVFDHGVWFCAGDPLEAIAAGKLDFTLEGGKLRGAWKLVRTGMQGGRGGRKPQWLLIKRDDRHARDADADELVEVEPGPESSESAGRVWISGRDGGEGGERKRAKAPIATHAREHATEPPSPRATRGEKVPEGRMRGRQRSQQTSRAEKTTNNQKMRTPHPASLREAVPPPAPRGQGKAAKRRRSDATWRKRALALERARDTPFRAGFKPELATLRQHPPLGDDWLHEIKWDGYRMLADLVDGTVRLRSRNDLDWTPDFPAIVEAIQALPVSDAHLDGELIALGAGGASDFALLQRTLQGTRNAALRYVVFDLPGVAGVDLSRAPLLARKTLLQALIGEDADGPLLYSQHVIGHGNKVFAASGAQGLEGIIAKRVDAPYTQARSAHWVKVKHAQGDEFVIVGYSAPRNSRSSFGALLMAAREADGTLRYVGRVGTGYTDETLRTLHARLQPLRRKTATVTLPTHLPHDKRDRGNITWLKPELVAEIAFRGWGKDGLLRQASFQRLRIDKTPEDLRMPETGKKSANRKRTDSKAMEPASRAKKPTTRRVARPATKKTPSRKQFERTIDPTIALDTAKAPKKPSPQRKLWPILTSTAKQADQNGSQRSSGRRKQRDPAATSSPQIQISSRDRVVYVDAGITKGEVADYYAAIAPYILPDLARRPLSLLRRPDGAAGTCFFQKHHAGALGAHVRAVTLKEKSSKDEYLYITDAAGLLELVQMNVLEFHPWGAHVDKPERPDTLVFDLDPAPGVAWTQVVAAARDVRARLEEIGLASFVRLSGGKGVHVVAPIRRGPGWDAVKDFTGAFAEAMAAHRPLHYVATMSKARREGRIFIDWLRNGRGATSVTSWSLRARAGAPVAMPIRWEELGRIAAPDAFDLRKALKRAKSLKADPWDGYASLKQSLPKLG